MKMKNENCKFEIVPEKAGQNLEEK